jgi:hypothetical protein
MAIIWGKKYLNLDRTQEAKTAQGTNKLINALNSKKSQWLGSHMAHLIDVIEGGLAVAIFSIEFCSRNGGSRVITRIWLQPCSSRSYHLLSSTTFPVHGNINCSRGSRVDIIILCKDSWSLEMKMTDYYQNDTD